MLRVWVGGHGSGEIVVMGKRAHSAELPGHMATSELIRESTELESVCMGGLLSMPPTCGSLVALLLLVRFVCRIHAC